jgi:hypothetical protein
MKRRRFSGSTGRLLLSVMFALSAVASAEWKEKVLYSFQGGTTDGSGPAGGVVFDPQGNLYGATTGGGPASCAPIQNECGTVFELTPPTQKGGVWTETLIYQFQGEGSKDASVPTSGLIFDAAGNLYGVTAYGGTGDCVLLGVKGGCGTVYELLPPTQQGGAWTETILYSFQGGNDGYFPWGTLVFDSQGNIYGATQFGGGKGTTCNYIYGGQCGTVFKLSPPRTQGGKWTEIVLHRFAGLANGQQTGDGANPNGGLVLAKGSIFGTTYIGGYNCPYSGGQGCGTVFRLAPPVNRGGKWTETVLHRFELKPSDGQNPVAGLIIDTSNNFYGTTLTGGPSGGGGAVFKLTPPSGDSGSWKETILYGFKANGDGLDLESPVVFDSNGNLYGTALDSGGKYYGTVYRVKPPKRKGGTWTFDLLYGFGPPPDGGQPAAGVVFDKAGNLYSTTTQGGNSSNCGHGCGTVFELRP